MVLLFGVGIMDDLRDLAARYKLVVEAGLASLLAVSGIRITSFGGLFGITELHIMAQYIITVITIVGITNAFNLIDGIDGLAGSLGLMATTIFGFYFLKLGLYPYSILSFATAGSVAAFLIFNFQPAKIFMGDTGSMLIGLINAILVVKFINVADLAETTFPIEAAPAIGFAILMVPLLDTLRVFAIRIANRRSPFSPDRNHVHHLLLDKGLSHRFITITLVSINFAFIVASYFCRSWGCTWLILYTVILFFAGIGALYYTRRKPRLFVAKAMQESLSEQASTKIVPLTKDTILEHKN